MNQTAGKPKLIWGAAKWSVFALVLGFVAWHAWTLWQRLDASKASICWGWLTASMVMSVVAWGPSVWFWRWVMSRLGSRAPWPAVTRAYFCGGLGKYLPGKAAVILLRAAMLKPVGVPATTAGLAVTHETLTCMWAGGLTIILLYSNLAPFLPEWMDVPEHHPVARYVFLAACMIGGATCLSILVGSHRFLRRISEKVQPTNEEHAETTLGPVVDTSLNVGVVDAAGHSTSAGPIHLNFGQSFRMTLAGGAIFLIYWWLHGLSLGMTIMAVIGDRASGSDWPFWTGAAAVSLVGGFVVLIAPGGLGVREGLLLELLEHQLGPEAVVVTVLWRGVSLAGEFLTAGALYYGIRVIPSAPEHRTGN